MKVCSLTTGIPSARASSAFPDRESGSAATTTVVSRLTEIIMRRQGGLGLSGHLGAAALHLASKDDLVAGGRSRRDEQLASVVQGLVHDGGIEGEQGGDGVDVASFVGGEHPVGPDGLGECAQVAVMDVDDLGLGQAEVVGEVDECVGFGGAAAARQRDVVTAERAVEGAEPPPEHRRPGRKPVCSTGKSAGAAAARRVRLALEPWPGTGGRRWRRRSRRAGVR
jgi:hypothetical protein